ncbi:MAG: hypothetical protein EOM14_00315 [Clostridia bacterium]|nr:hypothetical protein [Clostridia bacterium]
MDPHELPLGFGMALAQNPDAMKIFSNLTESKQSEILQKAHAVKSKNEMQSLVSNLSVES